MPQMYRIRAVRKNGAKVSKDYWYYNGIDSEEVYSWVTKDEGVQVDKLEADVILSSPGRAYTNMDWMKVAEKVEDDYG